MYWISILKRTSTFLYESYDLEPRVFSRILLLITFNELLYECQENERSCICERYHFRKVNGYVFVRDITLGK